MTDTIPEIDTIKGRIQYVWETVFNEKAEVKIDSNSDTITINDCFDIAPHRFDVTRKTIAGPKTRSVVGYLVTVWEQTGGLTSDTPPDVNEWEIGERENLGQAIELLVETVARDRVRQALI